MSELYCLFHHGGSLPSGILFSRIHRLDIGHDPAPDGLFRPPQIGLDLGFFIAADDPAQPANLKNEPSLSQAVVHRANAHAANQDLQEIRPFHQEGGNIVAIHEPFIGRRLGRAVPDRAAIQPCLVIGICRYKQAGSSGLLGRVQGCAGDLKCFPGGQEVVSPQAITFIPDPLRSRRKTKGRFLFIEPACDVSGGAPLMRVMSSLQKEMSLAADEETVEYQARSQPVAPVIGMVQSIDKPNVCIEVVGGYSAPFLMNVGQGDPSSQATVRMDSA